MQRLLNALSVFQLLNEIVIYCALTALLYKYNVPVFFVVSVALVLFGKWGDSVAKFFIALNRK